ncbi:hypothetical protein H6P81_013377 [Aristolochia fimbriata]|uniref:Aminotransferase-like plant mobile domain-containing protein n=1 Tax=Aristolochia fimbriata TaxID=158543 RepID=A0AAV7EG60_ARIFI|nr:hypothetical protein H6P81_013377 [Aristolochia fimbriata]
MARRGGDAFVAILWRARRRRFCGYLVAGRRRFCGYLVAGRGGDASERRLPMAAPSVNLIGGMRVFDHVVTVGEEPILTLALYREGEASRITYCPSGESIFGGHAMKRPPLVDRSLPHGSLSRPFPPDEDVAVGPETLVFQSALCTVNQFPLPWTLADDFMDGGVRRNFYVPDTTLDMPLPFLFEWTTLLMSGCSRTLCNAGVYYGLWAYIFHYSCDASMVQAFIDTWCLETNIRFHGCAKLGATLQLPVFVPGVSQSLLMFGVPHFVDGFLGFVLVPTDDNVISVLDPWTDWHAAYEKGAATSREKTATEQDAFDVLHVLPGKEDEVHLAALLSVWLSRFVFCATGGDDLRPMIFKVASYMATGVRFALACPALTFLYCGSSGEEEGYDSDRSHPSRRRLKGKQPIGAPSAKKKRAPLAALNGASASAKKKSCVEAQPASHPSPPIFFPPILEMEPPHSSPHISCPPILEMEPPEPEPPVETIRILSAPEADPPTKSLCKI